MEIAQLEGRVAFVTGGAQGIGLGIARALAKAGAKVAVADVNADALATAEKELGEVTDVAAVELDVRDRAAFVAVADDVESTLGPVSLLFNNAGVIGSTSPAAMSYDTWDWVVGINLHGVYNGLQTFVPRMIKRGADGYVVNTASGSGIAEVGSGFLYATSKYAVVGLSESLNRELEHHNIGVSVLCPGPVATNIITNTEELRPNAERPTATVREALTKASSWLARGTHPDEVGEMVLAAIRTGRLHIFTDESMAKLIKRRTDQLLAALPSALQN